jgi:hypothetical protein
MTVEKIPSNSVLNRYIRNGKVDYQRLREDPWLAEQVIKIQNEDLTGKTGIELLAFWLNAYNITTIASVLEHLEKKPDWGGVTSLWSKFSFFILKKHQFAGRKLSLYTLENKIIRKFDDPRIHFALNCGSGSCPFLPGSLFSADILNDYLETLTSDFVNHQGGVSYRDNTLYLSKIFQMYKSDFGGTDSSLREFILNYWEGDTFSKSTKIKFQNYDWTLNSQ